ncbi:hypothetical protein [Gelidibacter salicanalis]|uniref:Uncharacterized protein n=1 Tax=Gelidibacter salicanalis TaxID=291193 RepID=A0A934KSP2_9FLAO|nr:hypothetical protein [Gelidibacter salicanalis]MBJ7880008.1 hypothetical protein [Gelidibacter salicanalis]
MSLCCWWKTPTTAWKSSDLIKYIVGGKHQQWQENPYYDYNYCSSLRWVVGGKHQQGHDNDIGLRLCVVGGKHQQRHANTNNGRNTNKAISKKYFK